MVHDGRLAEEAQWQRWWHRLKGITTRTPCPAPCTVVTFIAQPRTLYNGHCMRLHLDTPAWVPLTPYPLLSAPYPVCARPQPLASLAPVTSTGGPKSTALAAICVQRPSGLSRTYACGNAL